MEVDLIIKLGFFVRDLHRANRYTSFRTIWWTKSFGTLLLCIGVKVCLQHDFEQLRKHSRWITSIQQLPINQPKSWSFFELCSTNYGHFSLVGDAIYLNNWSFQSPQHPLPKLANVGYFQKRRRDSLFHAFHLSHRTSRTNREKWSPLASGTNIDQWQWSTIASSYQSYTRRGTRIEWMVSTWPTDDEIRTIR